MKRVLKILGIILVVLLVVIVIGGGVVYAQNASRLATTYEVDVFDFEVPEVTDELLAEGERIYITRGCVDCHGENGAGSYLIDDFAFGRITSSNITSAEYDYTAEDYIRAIMYGVGVDNKATGLMPSTDWGQMREEDLGALLAYLMNLEPVENDLQPTSYGPMGHILIATNQIPIAAEIIDVNEVGLVEVEPVASIEFGEYLTQTCSGCHGSDFAGDQVPGSDYTSSNLTPDDETGIGTWTVDDFQTALKSGVRPDGTTIDPERMPWPIFVNYTDTELEAMYLYFHSLDPITVEAD